MTLESIWDQRDQIIERLMGAQTDTARGAMLGLNAVHGGPHGPTTEWGLSPVQKTPSTPLTP